MKKISHLALTALFFLTACAGDKYPMPSQFVGTDAIAITALGAPPAKGSKEYENEIIAITHRQAALTDADKKAIMVEDHITPTMIVQPVLGTQFTEAEYPKLYALLRRASSDAWRIADTHQEYWMSPRPWYADARVKLLVSSITRPGYPSGHTTTNTTWAYILSDLFPQKRAALFARAYEIGYHRVDAGAHFPHDVEAGKRLAGLIYGKLRSNADYQAAFAEARAEMAAHATPVKRSNVAQAAKAKAAAGTATQR